MKLFAVTVDFGTTIAGCTDSTFKEYALTTDADSAKAIVLSRAYSEHEIVKVEEIEKDYVTDAQLKAFNNKFYARTNRVRWGQAFLNEFDDVKSVKALRWGGYLWQEDNVTRGLNKVQNEMGIIKYD